jgi:hypothetical protein
LKKLLSVNNLIYAAFFGLILCLSFACKNSKSTSTTVPIKEVVVEKVEETAIDPRAMDDANDFTRGKVSLELKKNGCVALVIAQTEDGEEIILIPKSPLGSFEVEGKKIKFHYRLLRMPQPVGCTKGVPAELSDVTAD